MTLSPYLAILFMPHFGRAPSHRDIFAINRHNGWGGLRVLVLVKEVCGKTTNTGVNCDSHIYKCTVRYTCVQLDT